jgi:hypothetical protein
MQPSARTQIGHLRLVVGGDTQLEPDPEPPPPPPPVEVLERIDSTLTQWLTQEELLGHDGLQQAFRGVLHQLNDLLLPHLGPASEGAQEILRMATEGSSSNDPGQEELHWGAREFLRLAALAAKVTPFPRTP